jgi:hypothetical protein
MKELTEFNTFGEGRIDRDKGLITGVSLITMGNAKGHNLVVDEKTLSQLAESLENTKPPGIKAKLNHRSGVEAVFGFINNIRVEGMKLVGDLNMLQQHKDYNQTMEQLETMPGQIGLSVAFQGDKEKGSDGRVYARCKNIVSVDLVPDPAANPDGLFESKVDSITMGMEDPNTESDTAVLERLTEIAERLEGVEGFQDDLSQAIQESIEEGEGEEYEESYEEAPEAEYDEGEEVELGEESEELSSVDDALTYLEAKAAGALEAEQEIRLEGAFDSIEDKVTHLSSINEELIAENEALHEALELSGVRPLEPGRGDIFGFSAEEGTFEFSAQSASEGGSQTDGIMDAVKNDPRGHREWLVRQGVFEN